MSLGLAFSLHIQASRKLHSLPVSPRTVPLMPRLCSEPCRMGCGYRAMGCGSFTLVFLGQGGRRSSHTYSPWRDAAGSCETATTLPSSPLRLHSRVSGCWIQAHCCQQEPFTSGDRESDHRDPRMRLLGPPCASGPFLPRHSCCAGSPEGAHCRVSQAPLQVGGILAAVPFCSVLRALVLVRSLPGWYPDSTRLP